MSHTPGPWNWITESGRELVAWDSWQSVGHYDNPILVNERGEEVVEAGCGEYCPMQPYDDPPRRAANARLIAAAPELLEALRDMVQQFGYYGSLEGEYVASTGCLLSQADKLRKQADAIEAKTKIVCRARKVLAKAEGK